MFYVYMPRFSNSVILNLACILEALRNLKKKNFLNLILIASDFIGMGYRLGMKIF